MCFNAIRENKILAKISALQYINQNSQYESEPSRLKNEAVKYPYIFVSKMMQIP